MNNEQLLLPLDLGRVIPEDDSVRLLNQVLEEVDYKELNLMYSIKGRKPAVSPKTIFKIMVYGYMNGIYSTRKLESACKRDINFMWLLGDEKAPDHTTISRFRTGRLSQVIDGLFAQLIKHLKDLNEVSYENMFVDGTKIESVSNKYTFVWKKSVAKNEVRLQEKIKTHYKKLGETYELSLDYYADNITIASMSTVLESLEQIKTEENISFVYGKGKRKTSLQRDIETLVEYLERQTRYDGYSEIFEGRNSFSKTDPDATFMHMKEDHMRNAQLKPAYNVQIGVEGEYVVAVDISNERSDQLTLIPFLEKSEALLGEKYANIIADAGYESEHNYVHLEKSKQEAYIKPNTYEQMKKKKFKNKIGRRENMEYNHEKDTYICTNGMTMNFCGYKNRTSKSGYVSKCKVYECEDCSTCKVKKKCTRAEGNRRMEVSEELIRLRAQSLENITSSCGKELRMNRSIQVEGVFGVLKQDYGFRRFLTRGRSNVSTEFTLLCFGYNLNKLHKKIQTKRLGTAFHKLKIA